jgi:hypothetical protein
MSNSKSDKTFAKYYLQSAFVICTAILAIAGSGMSLAIKSFGVYLIKEPIPLKKPLDLLGLTDSNSTSSDIGPYKVVSKTEIDNEEIVESLGTTDYIQWHLEDTLQSDESPLRYCSLFITYYGIQDRVPHVPEECYMGSGYQRLASESVLFTDIFNSDSQISKDKVTKQSQIPARYLVFAGTDGNNWASETKFSVFYLFSVNGVYTNNRTETRAVLNKNLFGKYSYFSKVEWKFYNKKFGSLVYPKKEKAIQASKKLLRAILPLLEEQHWPDMEQTPD